MRPAARVQAAIDLLDEVIAAARDGGPAADAIAAAYFRSRRYIGSGDRRAVRDLAYRAIRRFGDIPESGRAAMIGLAREDDALAALFDGSGYGPAPIAPEEPAASGGTIPAWLAPRLYSLVDDAEREALLDRAELDLRFRPERIDRAALTSEWPEIAFSDALPHAARLPHGTAIEKSEAWRSGAIEVQDWGSQAIVAACVGDDMPDAPLVVDLCAGAGGKALALAAALGDDAQIIASDISRARLNALTPRRERAGAVGITPLLLDPRREMEALEPYRGRADLVLVDAPCSGTGTWRRNPETRWRLTPDRLERLLSEQARLIDIAATLVRPGGTLVYAVCSLLKDEGQGQIERNLCALEGWHISPINMPFGRSLSSSDVSSQPDRAAGPVGLLLTPQHDGTDGFFFARAHKAQSG